MRPGRGKIHLSGLFFLDQSVTYIYVTVMTRLQLQKKRESLLRQLQKLGPWIEGSLVATARKCGKPGCACHHDGPKHPVLFVTWKEGGKTVSLYILRQLEVAVKEWTENYKQLKTLIRQVFEVPRQLVRLRD